VSINEYGQADAVITALMEGRDPETRQPLPPDSVVHRVDVIRALMKASESLKDCSGRAERRAQLPDNAGGRWTKEEEATVVAAFKSNESVASIAARHGRTVRGIESRLERLGIITADQRTTRNIL
jgi:hypothetical protein